MIKLQIILLVILMFMMPMFIYSGVNKIINFPKKTSTLYSKLPFFPMIVINIGMILVIILEIVVPLLLFFRVIKLNNSSRALKLSTNICIVLLLLFILVATILYHKPSKKKKIPFLNNMTHFGSFILLLIVLNYDSFVNP